MIDIENFYRALLLTNRTQIGQIIKVRFCGLKALQKGISHDMGSWETGHKSVKTNARARTKLVLNGPPDSVHRFEYRA